MAATKRNSSDGRALKTNTVFRHRHSGNQILALSNVRISASSDAFRWQGMQVEVGSNHGWSVDDVMVDGHYLAINLADTSLHFQARYEEADWTQAALQPLSFWINPEGRPFSLRHVQESHWAGCLIEGSYLDEVMGRHYELRAGDVVIDETLARLLQAVIAHLLDGEGYAPRLTDELIRTFVYALASRHGHPAAELATRGGIAPAQLNALLSWLGNHLDSPLTVQDLASKVGLSAAHFSREFKHSTGVTPWGYVVQLRLEAARKLLEDGVPVCAAALRTGFSDQPHLSRLFKLRFGMPPSAFAKSTRREKLLQA